MHTRIGRWMRTRSPLVIACVIAQVPLATCATVPVMKPFDEASSAPQPVLGIIECPHTWTVPKGSDLANRVVFRSTIARSRTNVPEYHDCQRLMQPDGRYGPLVAVFAWDSLEHLDALLHVQPSRQRQAFGVAEIWNTDTITYAPLNIRPGFMCLYLYAPPRWRAKLVRYGDGWPQPDCTVPIDPASVAGLELSVTTSPLRSQDFGDPDFPPVARWEWDPTSARQYIGVPCGSRRWCEIGLPQLSLSPSHPTQPVSHREVRRVREIKGWYDEQRLTIGAVGDSSAASSSAFATVFPDTGLNRRDYRYYSGEWRPVAFVKMGAQIPGYLEKYNFRGGDPRDSTTISICRGSETQCKLTGSVNCAPSIGPGGDEFWWARLEVRARPPLFKCVRYIRHPDIEDLTGGAALADFAPGTARWRWVAQDETIWTSCPFGCCEIQG